MEQGKTSSSTPSTASSSVGMTSTKCAENVSKNSDQDCITIPEDGGEAKKPEEKEKPAKKQKANLEKLSRMRLVILLLMNGMSIFKPPRLQSGPSVVVVVPGLTSDSSAAVSYTTDTALMIHDSAAEEKKEEPAEESDDDMGFSLFD
ncbi:hypothetical protein POM88_034428 [Heracleum sosnowskyi]|uniref:Uncharacterized protein n=1 Tax=Heracleum sosnowskyi TaxID=360622 RepID=A0AAD8HKI7_9APIA|nr:hypothetical protein POM88_034428 [Heracleum sosnowskyi]